MKAIVLVSMMVMAMMSGTTAQAVGTGAGNGGDGIVLDDGRTVFYDLFESSLDGAASMEAFRKDYARNFVLEIAVRSLGLYYDVNPTAAWDKPLDATTQGLVVMLDRMSAFSPALLEAVLKELKELRWKKAPTNLLPNEDTKPFLDLTGYRRIGCARNTQTQVLYSPSCSGLAMDPADKVALVLHEAVYGVFRRLNPKADDSRPVRSVIATLFDLSARTSFGEDIGDLQHVLSNAGFGEIAARDEELARAFSETYGQGFRRRCTFDHPIVKSLELQFLNLYRIRGRVNVLGDEPEQQQVVGIERGGAVSPYDGKSPWDLVAWEVSGLPVFDAARREIALTLVFNEDSRYLQFRLPLQNGESISIKGHDEVLDITSVQGICVAAF